MVSCTLIFDMFILKSVILLLLVSAELSVNPTRASTLPTATGAADAHVIGIAWKVEGKWQQNEGNSPLQSGDPILPSSLLMPLEPTTKHSITLLLPDGQRVLYECFTEEDCVRGFRTPALTEKPSPLALSMMRQISLELIRDRNNMPHSSGQLVKPAAGPMRTTPAKRDEQLVVLSHSNQVSLTGLLSSLPNGKYTYNLIPLDRKITARLQQPLLKSSAACTVPVPAAGLYRISLWDSQNTPRIDLFLAAIEPAQADAFSTYSKVNKVLSDWNEDYYGWPVHDLLRAYLESLMRRQASAL